MPIRNRLKTAGLRLQIPERKVSPRDWNLPYLRPAGTRWKYPQQQSRKVSVFRFIAAASSGVSSTGGTDVLPHVLTPTDQLDDPLLEGRRSSSGALLSPDVFDQIRSTDGASSGVGSSLGGQLGAGANGGGGAAGGTSSDDESFYLLKKDSQRRLTLVKVLQHDRANICRRWQEFLAKDVPDTCVTQLHLQILMDGLRGYIPEQSRPAMESCLSKLKDEFRHDPAKINQVATALYVFQDAVNSALRLHNIKPHWMFALDNLVRSAVQVAVTILTPEIGADLQAADEPEGVDAGVGVGGHMGPGPGPGAHNVEPDGASTSGVSTVNSAHGGGIGGGHGGHGGVPALHHQQYYQLHQLREENSRLLSQLLEMQQNYQDLIRHNLTEQKLHLQVLRQRHLRSPEPESTGAGQQQQQQLSSGSLTENVEKAGQLSAAVAADDANSSVANVDEEMVNWLKALNLKEDAINKFVSEDLSYSDVVTLMTRDDLRRLGLKSGPELRVWRSILDLRQQQSNPSSPDETDKADRATSS